MNSQLFRFDKKGLVILVLVAMVLLTMGSSVLLNKEVNVTIDGKTEVYNTTVETVEKFLEEENIEVEKYSYLNMKLDDVLKDGSELVINSPKEIIILDGTEKTRVKSGHKNVEQILKQHEIKIGEEDYTVPGIKTNIIESGKKEPVIIINRVSTETTVETVEIDHDIITKENPDMYKGETKVITEGQKGSKDVTRETVIVNDEEKDSRVVAEKVTKDPVTEVKEVGTKEKVVATNGGSLNGKNVVKTITMEATAYDPSPASNGKWAGITALGTKLRPGVVAVDRNVIPLGTKLYIESTDSWPDYGNAVAEDVGGAIKGNRIDLLFMDRGTCRQFGRRTVKVHVLGD